MKGKPEYISNEEEDKNDLNDDSISVIDNIDPNVLKKKMKYIVLIIDCIVKEAKEKPLEIELIREIKKKINSEFLKIHYIHVSNPTTYRGFLTSLTKFVKEPKLRSDLGKMYFDWKIKDKRETYLKSVINKRYSQLVEKDCGKSSEFPCLV